MAHDHGHSAAASLHDSVHYEHDLIEHDSWFRHDANAPHHKEATGQTNAWAIIAFMAATLGVVVVTGLVTYYLIFEPMMRFELVRAKEGRAVNAEYASMRADWQKSLNSYEWADPATGTVRVPLELAKTLQMREHIAGGSSQR